MTRSIVWRGCLLLTGVTILAGGPRHPRGSMADMLAHPDWVPSHVLILVGFAALLAALVLYRADVDLPARSAKWTRLAIWATALQTFEMVLHTVAFVDHHNLVAGRSTPVLSAHLAMSVVAYPIFGLACSGWVLATARDRTLASPWVAWLGIAGALAHGAAAPLVVFFEVPQARILFPLITLLALWCVLASFWPVRRRARVEGQHARAGAPGTPAAA